MREIKLNDGCVALVDDADYLILKNFRWRALQTRRTTYAARYSDGSTILMHREIAKPLPCEVVDHENRNGLDNTRANLRVCDQSSNCANSPPRSGKRFKGVTRTGPTWRASIERAGVITRLGHFKSEVAAALAYDRAAWAMHGKFARLNIPPLTWGDGI